MNKKSNEDIIESIKYWFGQDNQNLVSNDNVMKFFGLLTICAIIPFATIDLIQERYLTFLFECIAILLFLSDIIHTRLQGPSLLLRSIVLIGIGTVILFLVHQKGVIGIFWSFPYVVFLHFTMPPRSAITINVFFLLGMAPLAFYAVSEAETYRVLITLGLSSSVASIFSIFQEQQKKSIIDSEGLYRNLIETTAAVAWEVDLASRKFTYISPQIVNISGYPEEQWTDFDFWAEHVHPDDREQAVDFCTAETAKGQDHILDYRMITADDRIIWLRDIVSVIMNQGKPDKLRGFFIDITERKKSEEALSKSNRTLKVLDQCNQVLLHATDEQQLLDDICKIIVKTGESRMAGVGLVEYDENKTVRMVAHHGYEHDYLTTADVNWRDDNERGQGPVGIAIRTGQPYITRDMNVDQVFSPWKEAALMRGYASNVVLPLIIGDKTLGVLLIYSSIKNAIDEDELDLLHNLSNNMAYGMMVLRTNKEQIQAKDKLKESEERFRTTYTDAAIGMALISMEHRYIDGNPAFCKMLGFSNEELAGKLTIDLTFPGDVDLSIEYHEKLRTGELDNYHIEKRYLHKHGHHIWTSLSVSLVREKGAAVYAIAQIQDITERKQFEEELKKLSHAVEATSSSVIITNSKGNIEYVNPRFSEITGYTKEEVMGQIPRFLLQSEETPDSVYADISKSLSTRGEWKGEFRSRKKDGNLFWDRATISSVKDAEGKITHYIGIQDDVTREYELTEQLSYQASHDALTGLINRREFERRTERLLAVIRQDKDEHALCFMDLDQFKIVNDTCGHAAGDELLRQLSQVLQGAVRHRDTLARLGGDEFGVLMEHCTLEHAHRVAASLQHAVQDFQFIWGEHSFMVGVSIGLVAITEVTQNITELMKNADAACYMAKDLGRNRIHVYQWDDDSLSQRHSEMQWVTRIPKALEQARFCLYAQSIVPLNNSTDKHYELLIRMNDPKGKLILPGTFMPSAERYNLMENLDRWVIEEAFFLLKEHPEFLEQIQFISINLSGQSLTKDTFQDFILKQFETNRIPGNKICFEITETTAISNLSVANLFINRMKELGCQFALDDFGSGLSSFGYLKRLSVDYLKIDGMFIKDIVDDPIDHAMVKSINEIGQVMGMQTIAEFVENDEIKGMLREVGVNFAQGYGIDKPLLFKELLERSKNVTNIRKLGNDNDLDIY